MIDSYDIKSAIHKNIDLIKNGLTNSFSEEKIYDRKTIEEFNKKLKSRILSNSRRLLRDHLNYLIQETIKTDVFRENSWGAEFRSLRLSERLVRDYEYDIQITSNVVSKGNHIIISVIETIAIVGITYFLLQFFGGMKAKVSLPLSVLIAGMCGYFILRLNKEKNSKGSLKVINNFFNAYKAGYIEFIKEIENEFYNEKDRFIKSKTQNGVNL